MGPSPAHEKLTTVSNETLEILSSKGIIAINQDPVQGKSIVPFRWGVNVRLSHPLIHETAMSLSYPILPFAFRDFVT